MNLPNSLSLMRILLIAPFLIAVIYHAYPLALVIFLVAGVSDFLDGYLARHLKQSSLLGAYLDPLGDRLLTSVGYIALAGQGLLPAWLAVLVVAKDLYVALGAAILYFTNHVESFEVSLWGKFSTLIQFITLGVALLVAISGSFQSLAYGLFVATGVVTVVACGHYLWRGVLNFATEKKC